MSETGMPWTAEALADLRGTARAMGADFELRALAVQAGRGSSDVNQALHALLGRTAEEAAAVLEAEGRKVRDWILLTRSKFERAVDRLLG